MNSTPTIDKVNSDAAKLQGLKNSLALSDLLRFEFNSFKRVIENANYREFSIPKARGGKRTIEAPDEYLTVIQKRLNRYLQAVYFKMKPYNVYGFIQDVKDEPIKHNIITNAERHVGKNYVLNIDLKDFFHSFSAVQVRDYFQSSRFNFSHDLAICIALICCWKSRLPMGAATSPVISNMLCIDLDESLIAFAEHYGLTFTRYADDLTFSSDNRISSEMIDEIKCLIADKKFVINNKKFRLQSKFRQQTVTGIKVNNKLNIDRRYIRNVKAILFDIKINSLENAAMRHYEVTKVDEKLLRTFVLSIAGMINFIGQVRGKDDSIYCKLGKELRIYEPAVIHKV